MKRKITTVSIFLLVFMLTSCGGSGGGATGGPGSPTNPPANGLTLTLTPVVSSLPANTLGYPIFIGSPFFTPMNVRVTFPNGNVAPDGTVVNLTTSNVDIGFLSVPDDPETEDINEFTSGWITQNDETVGGIANFFLHSNSTPGVVTYTAAASSEGRSYAGTLQFTITEGPDPTVRQIQGVTSRTSLPVNINNVDYFTGTPFMTEVDVQIRDVFGNLTNPATDPVTGLAVATVSINPASSMYFTVNDDPATDINEFIEPQQTQGFVEIVNGRGNLFLWSKDIAADVTVSISAIETSGFELSTSFVMNVVNDGSNPTVPSSIALSNNGAPLYVNGSGGITNQNINVSVQSGNVPVLDPQVNNVRLSIVTDGPNSGEQLIGTNSSGADVQGSSINIATTNGIANALVNSGSSQNTITLTAVTDRSDNNVDNGIQDALTSVATFVVSDGVLWALELTTSALETLTVNGPQAFDDDGNPIIDADGTPVLDYQDGSYSLIVSAVGTDKGGNPALPQTVQFGMINSPITGYPLNGAGSFVHSSTDGNPQEGGSGFSSASGSFVTAAGGVQPNDTLVVFGEESLGNEDLESAVTVSNINSQSSLTILERFNRNDESGSINNDLGILPYAVGRAVDGNINATAVLNENGLATTEINYPVSQLGRIAAIYVKGRGGNNNGVVKTVTDVEITAFPGVEGYRGGFSNLIVSPNVIPANVSAAFTVCLVDSVRNPLAGRFVSFSYTGAGSGTIDGQTNSGTILNATDGNGCTTTTAMTAGLINDAEAGFIFSSGTLTCRDDAGVNIGICLRVSAAPGGVLNASPSSFATSGQKTITLTLYDGSGNVVEGVALSASCTGDSLGVITGPSVTDENGESTVVVLAALDGFNTSRTGTCVFATATGSPDVTVNFSGNDICILPPSPFPPQCSNPPQYSVGGSVSGMTTAGPLALQNNGTDTVNVTGNTTFNFPIQDTGTSYNVSVLTQPPGQTCTVANASGTVGAANVTNVTVTCT